MNRLSRAGIAVALLAGVLWAGGVAEAGNLLPTVTVCVDPSSGVVSRVASSSKCVGSAQSWSASQSAPLLCWNASSLKPADRTRVVSIAPSSGCAAPLRSVPVGSAQLLCAGGKSGVLRWSMTKACKSGNLPTWIRSASIPTTVATTSPITTPPTAVVVPSVSLSATTIQGDTYPKAVTVTTNVAGTIYFAEGDFVVRTVSDITSAPSHRWAKGTVTSANTPTSIAIDVDAVTNGYYRVYVANSQGVLSAPATKIVTVSVTRASTATTTTTVALSCANGGSCTVGVDTGPGGGIVFYYSASAFTSAGSVCNTNCHALEVAPAGWIVSSTPASQTNCSNPGTSTVDPECEWSGNTSTAIGSTAQGTAIGTGHANTTAIRAQSNTVGKAATTSRAYQGGGKTDWFLPSKDELNQLCRYAWNLTVANTDTTCTGMSGTIRTGFSTRGFYWSSSEFADIVNAAKNVEVQNFSDGGRNVIDKSWSLSVRPIRAF
jgi:hypothetical protein